MGRHLTEILPDRYVIDLTKPWHAVWWAEYFGVSEEMLYTAVALVGARAEALRLYLSQERRESTATDGLATSYVVN